MFRKTQIGEESPLWSCSLAGMHMYPQQQASRLQDCLTMCIATSPQCPLYRGRGYTRTLMSM